MSSIFGHSLIGVAICACHPLQIHHRVSRFQARYLTGVWLVCLVAMAVAPDLDYVVPLLDKTNFAGVRISHSLTFSLCLPCLFVASLWRWGIEGKSLQLMGIQAIAAGLSHVVLDLLVGVSPVPALWPFSMYAWRLPLGLLPSSGRLQWESYYLYRNLWIEMGVLLPLSYCIIALFWWFRRSRSRYGYSWIGRFWIWSLCPVCMAISAYFSHQSFLLPR